MEADAPIPQKYDEHRRPTNGRPRGGPGAVFMSMILKKTALPSEAQNEAAERPHQEWDTPGTKFDTLSNPHEMMMGYKLSLQHDDEPKKDGVITHLLS
jgi:hypothetical protein